MLTFKKIKDYASIVLLFTTFLCKAQTKEVNYYQDQEQIYKIAEKKASFTETIVTNTDGTKEIEVIKNKSGQVIRKETYKGGEPIGKWILLRSNEKNPTVLDYDFTVTYRDPKYKRPDSAAFLRFDEKFSTLTDNDSLKYKAPKLIGEFSIPALVQKNIAYPLQALTKYQEGTVYVNFVINETGSVEDINVIRGIHILLDKEAVRIVRLIKFSNPASLNGVSKKLSIVLPIGFRVY